MGKADALEVAEAAVITLLEDPLLGESGASSLGRLSTLGIAAAKRLMRRVTAIIWQDLPG